MFMEAIMPDLDGLLALVDSSREEIVSLEQALIHIPSVNTGFMPTGNETEVCDYIRQELSRDGIQSEILEAVQGRGNIIARLEGRSGKAGLMFMSHTDVVPVGDESKWRFPPFSATIDGNRIYGRGAADCKGLLTAQLMAIRLLKRSGIELIDSLVLASGADEEHGGRYGFEWLAQHHPEKISAPFAVNEGGGVPIKVGGGFAYVLGIGEKGRLQVEIEIQGASAHASVPWRGTNALYPLAQVLRRIEEYEPERDTSSEVFQHLSDFAIEDMVSPGNIDDIIAEMEPDNPQLALVLRALSRMTITPTMVQGGAKSNSVPESIRLTCDVRTLPHQDEDYLRRQLDQVLEGIPGVEFQIDYMAVPNSSPFETEFAQHIRTATAHALGLNNVQLVPSISTGFTDSRFTRPLGVITYGFSGSHPDDDPALSYAHGTNESIGIKSLMNSTKVMLSLAYELLVIR